MDHRELLVKYMRLIADREGLTQIETSYFEAHEHLFTAEEAAELRQISTQVHEDRARVCRQLSYARC